MKNRLSARLKTASELMNLKYVDNSNGSMLRDAREKARERFERFGVPLSKDEYWRFSSPERFTSHQVLGQKDPIESRLSIDNYSDDINIFFVDGVLDLVEFEKLPVSSDIEIIKMSDQGSSDTQWVRELYGAIESGSHKKIERPLAAFNTACASAGVFIKVKCREAKRIVITYLNKKNGSDSTIHNLIRLESDARVTLVEKGEGACRLNQVTEIELVSNAHLNHIRLFGHNAVADVYSQIFVRQEYRSRYNEFSLVLNNQFLRNEIYVSLEGEEAKVSLAGANLAKDESVQDDTIFIAHQKRNCESRQVFKKVLKENSTGIFQGKIYVTSDAQKTDGYQISKGLLIGTEAKFLTKPELEIYADDVICSHGSTSGAIDEENLFYLVSRGISKKAAISMLILAFLDEAVQEIESDLLADEIRGLLVAELEEQVDE